MDKDNSRVKIIVVISYFVMIVTSTFSLIQPFSGRTIQKIAQSYPNYVTPLDFFHLIWVLIYVLMGLYVIYQLDIFKHNFSKIGSNILLRSQIYVIAYCWLEVIWIFAWFFDYIALSLVIVLAMLICSMLFCKAICTADLSKQGVLFIRLPSSILYGWLTSSFVMNFVILLISIGFKGGKIPIPIWVSGTLLVTAIYAVIRTYRNRDVIYCLTILWSYIGILIRHMVELKGSQPLIISVVAFSVLLLAGSAVFTAFRKKSI